MLAIVAPATDASAIVFRVTEVFGCRLDPIDGCFGQTISIGLRMDPPPRESYIYGISASAFSYDTEVVEFVDGQAVATLFHRVAHPLVGVIDPIYNNQGGALSEETWGGGRPHVPFLNSVALQSLRPHPLDPGLDGVVGGGDAQVRMRFAITGRGTTVLRIGVYPAFSFVCPGDACGWAPEDERVVLSSEALPYVIPEPTTALLLGIGLAGLTTAGRSSLSNARPDRTLQTPAARALTAS